MFNQFLYNKTTKIEIPANNIGYYRLLGING
jgi:hypothetical protein